MAGRALNILAMERNPLCHKTMLNHITRLSQDVVDCGFRVARGAHAAVLVALEEGRVSWMEPEAIDIDAKRQCLKSLPRGPRAPIAHRSAPVAASAVAKSYTPGTPTEDPHCMQALQQEHLFTRGRPCIRKCLIPTRLFLL